MQSTRSNAQSQTPADPPAIPLDDLYTIEDLAAAFPRFLTVRALRWQLRNRDTNSLASAVVPLGKRLLISRTGYEAWLGRRAGTQ